MEKFHSAHDAVGVSAFELHVGGCPCAYADEQNVRILVKSLGRHILTDLRFHHEHYAHVLEGFLESVKDLLGQSVFGDAVVKHSTNLLVLVENGDFEAVLSEIIRGGQS